jgi:hypothetical protein
LQFAIEIRVASTNCKPENALFIGGICTVYRKLNWRLTVLSVYEIAY